MMSKLIKLDFWFVWQFRYHVSTSLVLFHRLIPVELTVFLTILSSIVFLTCPISDFVGLINLHVGLLSYYYKCRKHLVQMS